MATVVAGTEQARTCTPFAERMANDRWWSRQAALGETEAVTAVDDEPLPARAAETDSRPGPDGQRGPVGPVGDEPWTVGARWVRWLLLILALTVGILPVVLTAHRGLDQGWRPVADNPRLAVDAASFASGHPPLLGAHSTTLEVTTHITPVHHPGPSEAWLLGSVQAVWPGSRSLIVSVAALAAAAAAVIVLAASKIAGPWAGLAAGAVAGGVAARLGTPVLADIWNPYVPILPLAAAVTAAWAAALVRWRPGLPLAVLFGTISVQAHVTHAPLLVAAVAPAVVLAWVGRSRRADTADADRSVEAVEGGPEPAHGSVGGRRIHLVAAILALAIGCILWFPPVLSEATAHHSNVANLWRASRKDTGEPALGVGYGMDVFDRVVGRPPPFGPPVVAAKLWVVHRGISLGIASRFLVILLPAVAVLAYGVSRRDRLTKVIGASALALDLTALGLLSISTYSAGAALYQTRWLWSVSLLHWAGIAVAALHVARQWSPLKDRRWRPTVQLGSTGVVVILGLGAMAAAVWPVRAAASIPPELRVDMDTVSELQSGLADLAGGDQLLIMRADAIIAPATNVALETAAVLITDGVDVKISSANRELRRIFGGRYAARPGESGAVLVVADRRADASMTRRGFERVAATPSLSSDERVRLRAVTRRLRAELEQPGVRWTSYGTFMHLDQAKPDIEQLLRSNRLGETIFAGELKGRLPSGALVDTFTDLQRRARPETSFVVWRAPARAG